MSAVDQLARMGTGVAGAVGWLRSSCAAVIPHLIQPGAGQHSTHRSTAGLGDQTNKQTDEGRECRGGRARPEHGQEVGQRARYGGAGKHLRITLTRVAQTPSMLSPSPSKITDLAIPGASPRPTDLAAPANCETRGLIRDGDTVLGTQPRNLRKVGHIGPIIEQAPALSGMATVTARTSSDRRQN